ncbi:MAG: major capsid protein [Microvirus sp.]|nr:MAG: major capsid protein [Microvirus sp.]
MQHQFSQIPRADIPRSSFNRSHGYKTAFDAGYLVPFYCDEALPGDTFNLSHQVFARLATPIVPIMDNMFLETFYFAVPLRLLWDNFQKFNGEQINPGDSTDFTIPQVVSPAGGWLTGSLSDYMGLPIKVAGLSVSSLWHRAYNLIWNEWMRDENLQNSLTVPTGNGPDTDSTFTLQRRGKRHDYFTSCLPWPQKGPGVTISMGSTAPVYGTGKSLGLTDGTTSFGFNQGILPCDSGYPGIPFRSTTAYNVTLGATTYTANDLGGTQNRTGKAYGVVTSGTSGLYADLSTAAAVTINSMRQAFQLQKMQERDARGGSRYTEIIRSHFGVVSPDSRLQRPEFLGGSSSRVSIAPVPQQAPTAATPMGSLAAYGIVSDGSRGFVKSFVEHCVILGLVNVRADLNYQQGIPRMFSRSTRYDFYWPALAHLGEQAVLNKEIYAQATSADTQVWGYQERWAEYRYYPSQITGVLRSTATTPLDVWHLAQKFTSLPTLAATFIQDDPPVDRVIAVPSEPHFIFDSYISLTCARPMPVYSVPGLVDHF